MTLGATAILIGGIGIVGMSEKKGTAIMTEHAGLPVKGYQAQSDERIALANEGKELEERYLRWIDKLGRLTSDDLGGNGIDQRLLALARTNIQQGAMWAIRSIFQPARIKLSEDQ